MILLLSKYIMIFIVVTLFFCFLFPIHLTKKQIIVLWMIYIFSLAIIGYHIKPSYDMDLYKLFAEIDGFRAGTKKIFDSPLFITNILFWIVSKTYNNGWLVFLAVIIWGLCIKGILNYYLNETECSLQAVVLYFLAANGGCFIIHLLSGIRCSLAVSIWCYAYFKWYKNKKKFYFCVASMTVFIHTIGIILIGLTILFYVLLRKKSIGAYFITFLSVLFCGYLLNTVQENDWLSSFNISYFNLLAEKLKAYAIRGYEFQQMRELLLRVFGSIYLFMCVAFLHFKRNTKYEIVGFFILVMFAGFNMSILFERMPYALGILALPIINESMIESKALGKFVIGYMGAMFFGAQVLWGVYEISIWINFID